MPTYEELVERIGELNPPDEATKRNIHWVTDAHVVGISKTPQHRIEIFLAGPEITPASRIVKEATEHQPWWHQDAQASAFEANRLLLPAIGHFDQVAAFLCIELLRSGADTDLEVAFTKTEPILELTIERLRLADDAFFGLAGELLMLNAMFQRADDAVAARVVEAWDGWQQSLRDFSWGAVGVEVKTTTRSTSSHQIQGTHQVELNDGLTGGPLEAGLYLVSIGLQPTTGHDNSFTAPSVVDRIIERLQTLGREDVAETFVSHVSEYGSGSGFGYDHRTMSNDAVFTRPFVVSFVRAYDMTDENISVLRRADVVVRQHVDAASLNYTVDLPTRVSGDLNPVEGLNQAAAAILGAAHTA